MGHGKFPHFSFFLFSLSHFVHSPPLSLSPSSHLISNFKILITTPTFAFISFFLSNLDLHDYDSCNPLKSQVFPGWTCLRQENLEQHILLLAGFWIQSFPALGLVIIQSKRIQSALQSDPQLQREESVSCLYQGHLRENERNRKIRNLKSTR